MATSDYTDISGTQYEIQELSGIDTALTDNDDIVVLDSYASVPAFRVNVPEVSEASAKFIYNYFTADERETIEGNKLLDVSVSRDEEIFFQLNNDKKPRYVKIEFKPPKKYRVINDLRDTNIIKNNINKILKEGGVSNSDFVSFEIVDSLKEKSLYSMLNGAIFITQIDDPANSPQDAYSKLLEAQEDGSLTGEEKKLIASALQGIQSKGYKLASSDISAADAENADDLVSRQNFSIQANRLVFNQMVDSALRIPDSLFQDEFASVKNYAIQASKSAIKVNSSNSNSESLYTSNVVVINSYPISSRFGKARDTTRVAQMYAELPVIKHAGYVITKLEVLDDGLYEERGKLITDNPNGLYIIDENIRYGGVYVYEIRSIYYVKTIAEERTVGDPACDDVSVVEVLIASEGKMVDVHCIENIPPAPPSSIRVSFDYKARKPRISWQFPVNPQRDIKRFQIFKRKNVRQPFTLIAEYDFDNSTIRTSVPEVANKDRLYRFSHPKLSYVDTEWEDGDRPIYAVSCVDAHGMSSNYSTQMRFVYVNRTNKVKNIMISYPNAPKPYPNMLINRDSFEDAIKVSGYDRMRVYLDPEYYKVTKYLKKNGAGTDTNKEKDLNLLRIDENRDTYQIHMINIDNQKDKILNIRIGDFSSDPIVKTSII